MNKGAYVTNHLPHRIGAGLLGGAILLSGATGALAAKGTKLHAHRAVVRGQVSNLSVSGFTLTRTTKATATKAATVKTVQVTFSATVKERAAKGTTGALANGAFALVVGQKSATTVMAKLVVFAAAAKGLRPAIRRLTHVRVGTVTAGTPTSIAITTKAGKALTFTLTGTTKFRVGKQLATTAPTFTTGEKVRVVYKRDRATKSLIALAVRVPALK